MELLGGTIEVVSKVGEGTTGGAPSAVPSFFRRWANVPF